MSLPKIAVNNIIQDQIRHNLLTFTGDQPCRNMKPGTRIKAVREIYSAYMTEIRKKLDF